MKKKAVTQKDIAEALGYSRVTVSKILNGYGQTSDETKKKVLQMARDMGYLPKAPYVADMASEIDLHRRAIFICNENDFRCNYWTAIIRGVSSCLSRARLSLGLSLVSDASTGKLSPELCENSVVGFIIAGALPCAYVELLCTIGKPIVSLDIDISFYNENLPVDVILSENVYAYYTIVNQLYKQGYRKFAYFGSNNTVQSFRERWMGFFLALAEQGVKVPDYWMTLVNNVRGFHAADILRETITHYPEIPEVIVCQNDSVVAEICRLGRLGEVNWTEDIIFVGFDNSLEYALHSSHDYNVECYPEEMGYAAADMLLWRLSNPDRAARVVHTPVKIINPTKQ